MEADNSKYYLFYDGDCGFCNHWVRVVLENDKKDQFLFASLQSDFGQKFLRERGLERQNLDTLYLWKPESYYLTKSKAVMKIAALLGGKFSLLGMGNLLPTVLSDAAYDMVARNRKRLKTEACPIPSGKDRKKFVG